MDMLNKEQLEQAEIIINNMGGCGVTLANDLFSMVRTLQQQNAQMKEALDWYADEEVYKVRGSQGFRDDIYVFQDQGKRATTVLQSIQGGSHDPHE